MTENIFFSKGYEDLRTAGNGKDGSGFSKLGRTAGSRLLFTLRREAADERSLPVLLSQRLPAYGSRGSGRRRVLGSQGTSAKREEFAVRGDGKAPTKKRMLHRADHLSQGASDPSKDSVPDTQGNDIPGDGGINKAADNPGLWEGAENGDT